MNFRKPLVSAALALGAAVTNSHALAVVNGGFDNGLAGWSLLGDAGTRLGGLWLTTASLEGDDYPEFPAPGAFNYSGISAADVGMPNSGPDALTSLFLSGALDPDPDNGVFGYQGSAAMQSFHASAGDVLSFQWNFGTRDTADAGGTDRAFVVIDGALSWLASSADAALPGTNGALAQTGYSSFSYTFTQAAQHSIIFGVLDVGDVLRTSMLAIDQVQITPVPEPTTLALMIGGLGLISHRVRKQARA